MKKIVLFAIVLLSFALIACSGKKAKKVELETVTILYPGEETDRMGEFLRNEFAQKMAEDLGIKVEMVWVPWDQYWEQKDIMLAAKEPIDLYWDGLPDLSTMVNKKQCSSLNTLINQYGQDMLKVLPMEQLKGAMIEGIIYGIPSAYAPSASMYQLVCVRQDILEKCGMTEIKTAEDLKKFARLAQKVAPEMKGPADIIFKPLTRYFGEEQYNWIALDELVVFGEDTHKAYDYYETKAFQDMAKFNRSMYKEGLYSDLLTIKYNERDSRMQTGLYLWVEGSVGKEMEIIDLVRANAPEAVLKSYLLAPEKPKYVTSAGGEVLCIPLTAKNPSGAMRFLNWLYSSKENYLFALYGVEGKDYNIVNGRINKLVSDEFFSEWMFRNKHYQMFTPDQNEADIRTYTTWDDDAKISESLGFIFNNENVVEIEAALKEINKKQMEALRNGFVDFDTEYPKAIKALKEAGIDEYVAEVQRQLDIFFASKQ